MTERGQTQLHKIAHERTPCDRCQFFNYCQTEPAACADFAKYLQKSQAPARLRQLAKQRIPLREIYDFIFSPYDDVPTGEHSETGNMCYRRHPETLERQRRAIEALETAILLEQYSRQRNRALRAHG